MTGDANEISSVNVGDEILGEYDAVVVGAGVMGSSTAYELSKRGQRTLLLEQFDFLHRRGSSHGESRIIRRTYPEHYYTEMMAMAYALWSEAEREAGTSLITITGGLDFGPPDNKDLQAVISGCRDYCVPHEVLSREEVERRFPMSIPPGNIAVFCPQGGVVNATKAVATLQRLAACRGATLMDNARVEGWEEGVRLSDGRLGVIIRTTRGLVRAHRCIVTAGPWAAKLTRVACGADLPVVPLHTTVAYWEIVGDAMRDGDSEAAASEPSSLSAAGGCPVFINYDEPYIYGMPSIEYPGLIKVALHGGPPCDPDTRSLVPLTDTAAKVVGPFLAARFQGRVQSDVPVMAEACMYSMSPDQDFILDFLPPQGGGEACVLIAAGFSGHGFKLAPLVGKIMADLATDGSSPSMPMEFFALRRFDHSKTGNVKISGPQVRPTSNL